MWNFHSFFYGLSVIFRVDLSHDFFLALSLSLSHSFRYKAHSDFSSSCAKSDTRPFCLLLRFICFCNHSVWYHFEREKKNSSTLSFFQRVWGYTILPELFQTRTQSQRQKFSSSWSLFKWWPVDSLSLFRLLTSWRQVKRGWTSFCHVFSYFNCL